MFVGLLRHLDIRNKFNKKDIRIDTLNSPTEQKHKSQPEIDALGRHHHNLYLLQFLKWVKMHKMTSIEMPVTYFTPSHLGMQQQQQQQQQQRGHRQQLNLVLRLRDQLDRETYIELIPVKNLVDKNKDTWEVK